MDTELKMCSHLEMSPGSWGWPIGEVRPGPTKMVGCEHTYSCLICGFGHGQLPDPCQASAYKIVSIR